MQESSKHAGRWRHPRNCHRPRGSVPAVASRADRSPARGRRQAGHREQRRTGRSAVLVAAGIFCSRVTGLIRQRVFAHYFGLGLEADAFYAALRIPNFLQNLFGEGALSASFIPVYAGLLARGERRAADRMAGAIASLLALVVSVLVLVGVLATPLFIDVIAPGFQGDERALTIAIVRVDSPRVSMVI